MSESKTWSQLCLDPRWQKFRLQVFDRDGWACVVCGRKDRTLHAHHLWYGETIDGDSVRRRLPWEYELSDVVTLCDEHHEDQRDPFVLDLAGTFLDTLRRNGVLTSDLAEFTMSLCGPRVGRAAILRAFGTLTESKDA